MAIRPVDLQLAYMAAPQNAAVLSNAQDAPQTAQQAVASAFAAEVTRREEHVDESAKVKGNKVRPREEREQGDRPSQERRSPHRTPYEENEPASPLGLAGEGEHFIDVTA